MSIAHLGDSYDKLYSELIKIVTPQIGKENITDDMIHKIASGLNITKAGDGSFTISVKMTKSNKKQPDQILVDMVRRACMEAKKEVSKKGQQRGLDKLLIEAVRTKKSKAEIRSLIGQGADINCTYRGSPLLISTIRDKNLKMAAILFELHADLKRTDERGRTALHFACNGGYDEAVRDIIEKDRSTLNIQDKDGETPLHVATLRDDLLLVELLTDLGADLKRTNKHGETVLHYASKKGFDRLISYIIKNDKSILNAKDKYGETPLDRAIFNGHEESAELLVKYGADYKSISKDGETSLHIACIKGYDRLVSYMLRNDNSGVNIQNKNGDTPLHKAICEGDDRIAKILIDYKADVLKKNNDGVSQLALMCRLGMVGLVDYAIKKNQDLLNYKEDDRSLLHLAISEGDEGLVKLLVNHGISLDSVDSEGRTPLHLAIVNGKFKLAEILIKYEANLEIKDAKGRTPFALASENEDLGIQKLLIDHGVSLDGGKFRKIDTPSLRETNDFIAQANNLVIRSFRAFMVSTSRRPGVLSDSDKELYARFSERMKDVFLEAKRDIPKNKEKFVEYQTKILIDFIKIHLEFLFELHKEEILEILPDYCRKSFIRFTPTLRQLYNSYTSEQIDVFKNKISNDLNMFKNILERQQSKVRNELMTLFDIVTFIPPKQPKGVRESDLYLDGGICHGSCLFLASERLKGNTSSDIKASKEGRFYQAAYQIGKDLNELLQKKVIEGSDESRLLATMDTGNIDEAFQKKLGIAIGSVKKTYGTNLQSFIRKFGSIIQKLDVEKSPHFLLSMGKPVGKESGAHAIYCKLSPSYELQDVNCPGLILKTDDLDEFKMYLFFYFLAMAPREYKEIRNLRQILKRN